MTSDEVKIDSGRERIYMVPEPYAFKLTRKHLEDYLKYLEQSGCMPETVQCYHRCLERLYKFLPEDRCIQAGTLTAWQEALLETGYSVSTVNTCMAAVNGLMHYNGHKELQADRLPETSENIQPELTRTEYLRLLSTARMMDKKRIYLLIKLFGSTGLTVGELEYLTAEAVQVGKIALSSRTLRIPDGLKEELIQFIREEYITSGPVFVTREGKPQDRTVVTHMMKALCRDARVAEEKVNPRCLRKLYLSTQAGILENLTLLAEQAYDRILEKEQLVIGWGTDRG